ncbi:MAG: 50S ribosomal protein L17 [Alphaproteobacteria bacterium]|nr:50S ribosomal protein L17 [Alphaproteobacteria bacterium]
MRHGMSGRKLNRTSGERKALFMGLTASLLKHEQIKTTLPKAKDLRPIVEKVITLGKRGGLSCRRQVISRVGDTALAEKVMSLLADRYKDRSGGYLRIIKAGSRPGDNAPMAIIELVDRDITAKGKNSGPVIAKDEDAESEA